VIADRVDKRRFIIFMQLAFHDRGVYGFDSRWTHVRGRLAGADTRHEPSVSASAFDIPMRQSFIVEMVGQDDLMNAIALNSSLFNGARGDRPRDRGDS